MLAVASYNAMPTRAHGISPEAIWRACRPLESRGKHKECPGSARWRQSELTAAEWMTISPRMLLWRPRTTSKQCKLLRKGCDLFKKLFKISMPVLPLARTLGYQRKKTQASAMPVLSGDRGACPSFPYRSSCGHAKFETDKDGGLKEFVVESITSSIAKLKQTGTDAEVLKHVAMLQSIAEFFASWFCRRSSGQPSCARPLLANRWQDRRCLPLSRPRNGLAVLSGVPAHRLHDSDEQSLQLRRTLVGYSERYVQGLPNAEVLRLAEHVATESTRWPIVARPFHMAPLSRTSCFSRTVWDILYDCHLCQDAPDWSLSVSLGERRSAAKLGWTSPWNRRSSQTTGSLCSVQGCISTC